MDRVLIHREGAVARIELNRPDKHNGVDLEMIDALLAAAATLRSDRTIRGVIIHGAGPSFCAGLDIKAVMGQPARAAWAALALLKPTANTIEKAYLAGRDE